MHLGHAGSAALCRAKKKKIKWKEDTDYKMDAVLILKMGTGNGAFRVCQRDKTQAHTRVYTSSEGDRGTG